MYDFLVCLFLFALLLLLNHLEILGTEHKVAAEVLFFHNDVVCQFRRGTFEEDTSLEEQVGAVCDAERLLHVVVGDEDADVAVLELIDHSLDRKSVV